MYQIIVKIKFEYAHRLINHAGKCQYVHGHSGKIKVLFEKNGGNFYQSGAIMYLMKNKSRDLVLPRLKIFFLIFINSLIYNIL